MIHPRTPSGRQSTSFGTASIVVVAFAALAVTAIGIFGASLAVDYRHAFDITDGHNSSASTSTRPPAGMPSTSAPSRSTQEGDADARARELLAQVTVVATRPNVPGYDRDCGPNDACVFGTAWTDDSEAPSSHNGCDTRNDVLAATLSDVRFSDSSPDCDVTGGSFLDPYTATTLDYAIEGSQIHIDHLFPLAAAWDLGAALWTSERRIAFANDTDLELLAVSGSANLSKSDSTPASWLPPNEAFRCEYVTAYLEVAVAYDLAITTADVSVIEPALRKTC